MAEQFILKILIKLLFTICLVAFYFACKALYAYIKNSLLNKAQYQYSSNEMVEEEKILLNNQLKMKKSDENWLIYNEKATNLISKEAMNDDRIKAHALFNLNHGLTVEESVMCSYLFDVTLQMRKAGNDVTRSFSVFASLPYGPFNIFKDWKNEKKISLGHWEKITSLVFKVAHLKCGITEAINAVSKRQDKYSLGYH